jgi:hypothetical protein
MKHLTATIVALAVALTSLAFVAPAEAKSKHQKAQKTSQPHKAGHQKAPRAHKAR